MSTQLAPVSGARTVADLPASAAERYGDATALRFNADGDWRELTYHEVATIVEELAGGLLDLGIEPGDRVCLLADTRVEWTLASFAISAAGAIVVPIYPTSSPDECAWVAGDSGARAAVCENDSQLAKIERVRDRLPALAHAIGILPGVGQIDLDGLRARGRDGVPTAELRARQAAVEPGDAYTFIYTSGTTGPPKGCVLTHANATAVGAMAHEIEFVTRDDLSFVYLPLAHAFALTTVLAAYDLGTPVVYYSGDPKLIIQDLRATSPTYVPSVPRIFEKLYAMGRAQLEQAPVEERARFEQAVRLGLDVRRRQARGERVPPELQRPFEAADERIFAPVRELFGGRVRQAVSGAAPIAPAILEFFYAAGVPVLEGWGMTETTAVGTVNTLDAVKFGTVGRPMPWVDVRIAEADGEILVRGPHVFREYWNNRAATEETFTDGWLRTGDIGTLDDEGFLSITGRKKDIIITAGGKNLTPANIENDLKQSRFISHVVMHGDRRPYPVALVTLDAEEIVPWAREQGLPDDLAELAGDPSTRALVQDELDRANAKYARVEQIKKFTILDHDFSQETGELTPTMKVKRNVVNERYADVFDAMYGSG